MKSITTYIEEGLFIRQKVSTKEKNLIKRKVFKELEKNKRSAKIYRDTNWQAVIDVRNDIQGVLDSLFRETAHEYDVSIAPINGGYRKNNEGTQWKEYKIELFLKQQDEPFMTGQLNCHAAGSVDDPFDRYDITIHLF
jgi:hypothetical protein